MASSILHRLASPVHVLDRLGDLLGPANRFGPVLEVYHIALGDFIVVIKRDWLTAGFVSDQFIALVHIFLQPLGRGVSQGLVALTTQLIDCSQGLPGIVVIVGNQRRLLVGRVGNGNRLVGIVPVYRFTGHGWLIGRVAGHLRAINGLVVIS